MALATGVEVPALRLERPAELNVLVLFASQLQARQFRCEDMAAQGSNVGKSLLCMFIYWLCAVCKALASLQAVCENLKGERGQTMAAIDPGESGSLGSRKAYKDNL